MIQAKLVTFCCLLLTLNSQYLQAPYAEWAHSHVVWLSGKTQKQSQILKLVQNYQSYGIPVGGVNIDSSWSTQYNNFQWNLAKFPHPQELVEHFHSQNIKVMLWVTSVINNDTDLYKVGVQNNYFLNHGKVGKWWHGYGAFIDYLNPKAVSWWHKLMDKVLDIGVDGFKCDGTDPLIILLRPWPYSPHAKRYIGFHEYGHHYYGDTYNYTKSKNKDALIMSRPTDFYNQISWNYSPKYVMFSGWVGDQDSSSEGFKSAMSGVLLSAWNNYLNFGFDIGGYRGQNISKNIFIRWVQTGALVPFMQNGGNGKHQPWVFDQETVQIYKKFVDIHYQLKPTFLSAGTQAFKNKKSVIKPIQKKRLSFKMKDLQNFGYILCEKFLAFPIFEENGITKLVFPQGSKWIYYFDEDIIFQGGYETYRVFDLDESPFFMKENSVIALESQMLLVMLKNGHHKESFIYGAYSEDVFINFNDDALSMKIERYYKDEESKINFSETIRKVRLVGFDLKIALQVAINEEEQTFWISQQHKNKNKEIKTE